MAFHGLICACTPSGSWIMLQAVQHLLARRLVRRAPAEVALHVGETEERLRARVLEAGHAGEADLERDGDVALDVLGAHAVGLRDDLDERRHRVRVRLDVELLVRPQPRADERRPRAAPSGRAHGAPTRRASRSFLACEEDRPLRDDERAALGTARERAATCRPRPRRRRRGRARRRDGRRATCPSRRTRPSARRGGAARCAGSRAPCARRPR